MTSQFRHVALIGKYHAAVSGSGVGSPRAALEDIAQFLGTQGCEVVLEHETAANSGLQGYPVMDLAGIGKSCDLALTPLAKGIISSTPL